MNGNEIFEVGDFVYYDENEIGEISDVTENESGVHYRINYCQGKDLVTGPRGGNGPIWRKGYPKSVTYPTDVLFVAAMIEKYKIDTLRKELLIADENFAALEKSRYLITSQLNKDCQGRGDCEPANTCTRA